jgi:ubiquinone/menaquinone biosynthesis C-methylase UbiE
MDLVQQIRQLYSRQISAYEPDKIYPSEGLSHYLNNDLVIRRKIEAFHLYKNYLTDQHRILDWGCKAALDAYLIRTHLPNTVEIHGCDVSDFKRYEILYQEANLIYSQLNHPYELPYEDGYFDVVIGSGVLEHVPNDYESLKELYRVTRNDGYLAIDFLPNILSYTEFLNRLLKHGGHVRKYSIEQIKNMLLHVGFLPQTWGYHQFAPSLASFRSLQDIEKSRLLQPIVDRIYDLNQYAEKLWIVKNFSANIFVISQKKAFFGSGV